MNQEVVLYMMLLTHFGNLYSWVHVSGVHLSFLFKIVDVSIR
jgi:hypothetical protein